MTQRLLAALGLVVSSPFMAVAAVAIKGTSPGPVLFRAIRVGVRGRPFVMFKLRTMHIGAPDVARITAGTDDRVSPVGRWLRRFKLDEVPQLINVVKGEMAIVGPRPEDLSIVDQHYTPFMRRSLEVPPGLTSPGSLSYFAYEAELPSDPVEAERTYLCDRLPRKIALDLVYVDNRSRRYDLELVLRTIAGIAGVAGIFRTRESWEHQEAERLLKDAGVPTGESA